MMFDYHMITNGWGKAPKYPTLKHCKAFKWQEDLCYRSYAGLALPDQYANTIKGMANKYYHARMPITHYCMYTKELYEEKCKFVKDEYGAF